MLNNRKIGFRLVLGFCLMIGFMIAVIVVSINQMAVIHNDLERIVKINTVRLQKANTIIDVARETALAVRDIQLLKYRKESSEQIQKIRDMLSENREIYKQRLAEIKELTLEDDKKGHYLLGKIDDSGESARKLQDKVIELALTDKLNDATGFMLSKAYPTVRQWIKDCNYLIIYNEERNTFRYKEALKAMESTRIFMFMLGVTAIILAIAAAIFLT